jgi:hypothetical protein
MLCEPTYFFKTLCKSNKIHLICGLPPAHVCVCELQRVQSVEALKSNRDELNYWLRYPLAMPLGKSHNLPGFLHKSGIAMLTSFSCEKRSYV